MKNNLIQSIITEIETGKIAPACSFVVTKNNNIESRYVYGNLPGGKKITLDTPFDLASITKLYTTAIILKLHNNNKLNIFSECKDYLDIFNNSKLKTIDLLTHQANFGIRLSEYREKYEKDFKKIFEITPPIEKFESTFYENITFLYLGKIIEKVTNKDLKDNFVDFFQEYNLQNTYLGLKGQKKFISPPTETVNNTIVQNITHDESARLLGGIAGNAGVFASVSDLSNFGNLWLSEKIIENDFKNIVFNNYDKKNKLPRGIGWAQYYLDKSYTKENIFLHTGFTGCLLAIHIPSSTVCAFVSNRTFLGRDNIHYQKIFSMFIESMLKVV